MQINRVGSIIQLAFMPKVFPVNCYFVEEEDGLTLIDTGMDFCVKGIVAAAKEIGKPIVRIVLTHAHDDHVLGLDSLKELYPDVPVYLSKRDSRLLAGDKSLDANEPGTPIKGGVPKNLKTKPDILLEDGDIVGSLLVVSTPGHTPGSMSFFDTRSRAIVAGDAFQTKGGIAVSGKLNLLFPFPAMATWNKEVAIESARKIRELNPILLAVGHGKMIKDPVQSIDVAIEAALRAVN
ncbi:glyoxylase-like metal-dependent hydrolase (beta-lactamase superfamily II) [Bacillus mesophilus]|uniref:MBL fold metallo-hydrolase n=1 Tax=Bacillus mesophilus TaxID=1808955 RepID=A0A6M0Q9J0_9BACI|nr:MBL fold metallo-hydrolase [Bacillus mesophilus]MBM7662359.1 glyoxylase-like metal-dependent hydrolase (beta-lactamase superfamily II) [Bacillus mesophilus]NEY73012.1 MBL fold metallo-hydrolase [Bacillus mesophilus]